MPQRNQWHASVDAKIMFSCSQFIQLLVFAYQPLIRQLTLIPTTYQLTSGLEFVNVCGLSNLESEFFFSENQPYHSNFPDYRGYDEKKVQ